MRLCGLCERYSFFAHSREIFFLFVNFTHEIFFVTLMTSARTVRKRTDPVSVWRQSTHTPDMDVFVFVKVTKKREGEAMTLGALLLIILIAMLIGTVPEWSYSRDWGYGPSSLMGIVLVVVLISVLTGKL
jgi:hypothetical protein